jgi:hypothetical protein
MVLSSREAENILPITLYSEISVGNPQRLQSLSFLEKVVATGPQSAYPHLDIKDGVRFRSIKTSANTWTFWSNLLPQLQQYTTTIDQACVTPHCSKCDPCNSKLFPGFNDVLVELVEKAKKMNWRTFFKQLQSWVIKEVQWIGDFLSSWCCGSGFLAAF